MFHHIQLLANFALTVTLSAALCGVPTRVDAGVQDQFDFNGGFHDGIFGSPFNDLRRFATTATSAYALQAIHFAGTVLPEQDVLPPPSYPSWGRDLFARVTHERTQTQLDIRLGYGTNWVQSDGGNPVPPDPAALSGMSYQMAGLEVRPGDAFTIELWDAFDDLFGADATWSNLSWQLTDEVVPKLGPVAPGRIRIDASGFDSFPTVNAALDPVAGSKYWGIEYGSGPGGQRPAIASVTFDTQNVGEVWWQNRTGEGQFVVGESQGIDAAPTRSSGNVLHELEDPLQGGNFQRLELKFDDGDFGPGDSLRFGNDMDSFATAAAPFEADIFTSGADFVRYDPGIRVIVRFEDGSLVEGLLNQLAPGESMRSYVDLIVPDGSVLEADFNQDGNVNGEDFLIWQDNFLAVGGVTRNDGDADGNGRVDGADFLIWQVEFANQLPIRDATIPEPTAMLSTWTMLLGFAIAARRRRGSTT